MKSTTYAAVLIGLATAFSSCSKEELINKSNDSFSAAYEESATDGNVVIKASTPSIAFYTGEDILLEGTKNGNTGTIYLYAGTPSGTPLSSNNSGNPRYTSTVVAPSTAGNYCYWVVWHNNNGGNIQRAQLCLTVIDEPVVEECDGAVELTASGVAMNCDNGTYQVTYTVKSCASYEGLKLQGGLTANATNISVSPTAGHSSKTNNKNTVHTWDFDLVGGVPATFTLTYKMGAKGFSGSGDENGMYPITGAWSVKQNSTLLAGYNNIVKVSKCP